MLRRVITTLAILVATIGITEWYLGPRPPSADGKQPNYDRLVNAHAPYSVKHPHSKYGFFLPDSSEVKVTHPDKMVHISANGFRGLGPQAAGVRALAFLVGNSVVFGFAQHDSLTISGFLNRVQNEFYFVNAGVPSWVSSQVRRRVLQELLAYRPALIVFWGGYNDVSLAYSAAEAGQPFSANLREQPLSPDARIVRLLRAVAPNLTARIGRLASTMRAWMNPVALSVASAAADAFIANVEAAYRGASDSGVRFLAVYQPILHHHRSRPRDSVSEKQRLFFECFRERVLSQTANSGIPFLDLGDFFDVHFVAVPVFTVGDGSDLNEQIFIDTVHLYVPGNNLVARAISGRLIPRSADSPQ